MASRGKMRKNTKKTIKICTSKCSQFAKISATYAISNEIFSYSFRLFIYLILKSYTKYIKHEICFKNIKIKQNKMPFCSKELSLTARIYNVEIKVNLKFAFGDKISNSSHDAYRRLVCVC